MKFLRTGVFLSIFLVVFIKTTLLYFQNSPAMSFSGQVEEEEIVTPTPEVGTPEPTQVFTPTATSTPLPSLTPAPTSEVYGPADLPADINPLTGLPVANPTLLDRRPIAIKVCNYPRKVRPQYGLNLADHVLEYYIGDHMTRFVGVYFGNNAERVGPVRSARLFDEQVMRMYNSYFVFGYADPKVRERLYVDSLKPYLVIETKSNCPPICRYENGLAWNNLFADTGKLTEYLDERRGNNQRPDLEGLAFGLDAPKSGSPGEKFTIHFTTISYHYWEYDPESGAYLRWQEANHDLKQAPTYVPLYDALTDHQIFASNVVVLFVPHTIFYKSSSTEILDITLEWEGQGYAFRDGQLYPIQWVHKSSSQMFSLYLPNGEPYPLKPGNTWFEILSNLSTFEPRPDGTWHFEFIKPVMPTATPESN